MGRIRSRFVVAGLVIVVALAIIGYRVPVESKTVYCGDPHKHYSILRGQKNDFEELVHPSTPINYLCIYRLYNQTVNLYVL